MKLSIFIGLFALTTLVYADNRSQNEDSILPKAEFIISANDLHGEFEKKDDNKSKTQNNKERQQHATVSVAQTPTKPYVAQKKNEPIKAVAPQRRIHYVNSGEEVRAYASKHTFITQQDYPVALNKVLLALTAEKYTANSILIRNLGNTHRYYFFR